MGAVTYRTAGQQRALGGAPAALPSPAPSLRCNIHRAARLAANITAHLATRAAAWRA